MLASWKLNIMIDILFHTLQTSGATINRNIVKGPDYGVNVVKQQQLGVPTQPGGMTLAVPVQNAMQSQISGRSQ